MSDEHRRAILDSLIDASGQTLAFDTLVDRVADRVGDDHAAGGADERRQRLRIALHHRHLPKLEAARIIDYAEGGDVQFVGGPPERDLLTLVGSYDTDD